MVAQILDGAAIARRVRLGIQSQIADKQASNSRFRPCLQIIQVGHRSDSSTYVRMKLKAAQEAGVHCALVHFEPSVSQPELLDKIAQLNRDVSVHAILVQLPLPPHLSEHTVTAAVALDKDVDGFASSNIGELAKRAGTPLFIPCTPKGVLRLLREARLDLVGKSAVVLGRSNLVGGPISQLLCNADCTVTTCHSKTLALQDHVQRADIVVAAIGKPQFVKGHWLKPGAVVIDVGTNYITDTSRKNNTRLVGDVDFESASQVASIITPVPGGVGPMTVAMLLENVYEATVRSFDTNQASTHSQGE
ncbi:hypothetical protein CDD81_2566 [Ophiocordyceps australis]|uniref:Uncharacterized protein n=1 Tax=Ophiocordyceps australis TaxID=1399860 RepID=A0A2C5X7J8_9HYPO|nr:hypothetical protein CDD81_2566 [Ophiocordyceps australis]